MCNYVVICNAYKGVIPVSYTHLDVYKRQLSSSDIRNVEICNTDFIIGNHKGCMSLCARLYVCGSERELTLTYDTPSKK